MMAYTLLTISLQQALSKGKKYLNVIKNTQTTEEEISEIENRNNCTQVEEEEEDTSDLVKQFKNLDHTRKWILSTGKCVENELFIFALHCPEEHPSKYFIMDTDDLNYTQYDVFTEAELEEIRTFEEKGLPMPSNAVLKHME